MKHKLIMLVDVPADLGQPSVEKADTLIFKIKPQTIVHIILRNSCFGTEQSIYIYIIGYRCWVGPYRFCMVFTIFLISMAAAYIRTCTQVLSVAHMYIYI